MGRSMTLLTPTLVLEALNHDCFHLSVRTEDQVEHPKKMRPGGLKERKLHQELGGHAEKEERAPVMTFHRASLASGWPL